MSSPKRLHTVAIAVSAAAVLAAGYGGAYLLRHMLAQQHQNAQRPLLLAPMLGVLDTCVLLPASPTSTTSTAAHALAAASSSEIVQRCTGPHGSAAALVESTLAPLEPPPSATPPAYRLGYTLQASLLQMFKPQGDDWVIDHERIGRLVRTVQENTRPVILYLFSTHFPIDAPLESVLARDTNNLLHTPDGPLPIDRYFGFPTYPWSFVRTDNSITTRRVHAMQALLEGLCTLPAADRAKIEGISLLGELHHLFPNFESGMGWSPPSAYKVTDYSPTSIADFQQYVAQRFGSIASLNRALGSRYARFTDIQPPARDIRTAAHIPLSEHLDSFAHGRVPLSGWVFVPGTSHTSHISPPWVHVYRNGRWEAKTTAHMRRDDIPAAHPTVQEPDTGWRIDLDFRHWAQGTHRLDVFVQTASGHLMPIGTRHVVRMGDPHAEHAQTLGAALAPLRPQRRLPASVPAVAGMLASVDMPAEHQTLYYNPLASWWHSFRAQQVVKYVQFFDKVAAQSCLATTPRYIHQLLAFPNVGWDESKYAVDDSLSAGRMGDIRLGVSLYGNVTYGAHFGSWLTRQGWRSYGVTEFHPLRALDGPTMQRTLAQHRAQGAQFVSFFMEPRWQGHLVPRGHNPFSFDPENTHYHSDALYRALDEVRQRPALEPAH